jgi:hypothetical protein
MFKCNARLPDFHGQLLAGLADDLQVEEHRVEARFVGLQGLRIGNRRQPRDLLRTGDQVVEEEPPVT